MLTRFSLQHSLRRLLPVLLTGLALAVAGVSVPLIAGALTPAQAQVSAEFQVALQPYGSWRRMARFGEVWVPRERQRDWRPYENGHWVYTDEWGWYWVPDQAEEDFGWVTYHYGRWAFERGVGWFWVPGDDWAPAWVDWRYGGDYVGWAPLPPDQLIAVYDEQPDYWIFVAPRYMMEPRLRVYIVPPQRRIVVWRETHVVNRTLVVEHNRFAVNAGLSPGFIAHLTGKPLPTYRVSPHVLAGTHGVAGAVVVQPGPRGTRVHAVAIERTTRVVEPSASAKAPAPLGKDERGRLGSRPPHAAQNQPPPAPPPHETRPVTPPPHETRPLERPPGPAPHETRPGAPPPHETRPLERPPGPVPHETRPLAPPPVHTAPPPAAHPAPPVHPEPPAAKRPEPPPHPQAPMARPAPPPHPPEANRPERKPEEKREPPK